MTRYGTWISYGGSGRIGLALVLLAVAAVVVYEGAKLPFPVRAARPGKTVVTFMLVIMAGPLRSRAPA